MKPNNVKKEFLRYVAGRGDSLSTMQLSSALEATLGFYGDVRADGCDASASQDMLLFQWGTYDWGKGKRFEVDMTRQFIFEGAEDEDIWQFHVTFRFPPSEELARLSGGNRWCRSLEELPSFAAFIREHPTIAAVGSRADGVHTLEYACAG